MSISTGPADLSAQGSPLEHPGKLNRYRSFNKQSFTAAVAVSSPESLNAVTDFAQRSGHDTVTGGGKTATSQTDAKPLRYEISDARLSPLADRQTGHSVAGPHPFASIQRYALGTVPPAPRTRRASGHDPPLFLATSASATSLGRRADGTGAPGLRAEQRVPERHDRRAACLSRPCRGRAGRRPTRRAERTGDRRLARLPRADAGRVTQRDPN